ncbi:ALG9 mannosyltransferase, partial [Polypterus senegalus]
MISSQELKLLQDPDHTDQSATAVTGYHAPLDLYPEFHRISKDPTIHTVPEGRPVNVCVGKEWYRFPSSFLLPDKLDSGCGPEPTKHNIIHFLISSSSSGLEVAAARISLNIGISKLLNANWKAL